MKALFTNPEVEVIEFDAKDVITTSCQAYDCPFDGVTTCDSTDDCDGIWSEIL